MSVENAREVGQGHASVVVLVGRDYRVQEKLRRDVEATVRSPEVDELIVDLVSVTFIDSIGVSVMLDARHATQEVGARVVMRGASDSIRDEPSRL